jgi:hypothetical protein
MKLFFTVAFLFAFIFQGTSQNKETPKVSHPNVHKIVVKEVLQTTSYTYLHSDEKGKLKWLAIPKMEATAGETYYYQGGVEMGEFKSKELNRTFDSILFLDGVISPDIVEGGKTVVTKSSDKSKTADTKLNEVIEPAIGGITIKELFINKVKYAGKVVKIRGKVTKFNSQIMGINWIHLQDGSGNSGEFDFTATTADEVNVGDVVTVEGKITLDKDFGSGYFYKIIMENGKVTK